MGNGLVLASPPKLPAICRSYRPAHTPAYQRNPNRPGRSPPAMQWLPDTLIHPYRLCYTTWRSGKEIRTVLFRRRGATDKVSGMYLGFSLDVLGSSASRLFLLLGVSCCVLEMADKTPSIVEASKPDYDQNSEGLERTSSITKDANGNTVITGEDGETFVIDQKAERALLWKFDLRILPLL